MSAAQADALAPVPLTEAVVMRLGLALHHFGTPAHQLEDDMARLARRFAVPGQFMSTPTYIMAAFGRSGPPRVYLERSAQDDIDLGKLSLLHEAGERTIAGELTLAEALVTIDRVLQAPSAWPWPAVVAGYGITSAAVARILDGGRTEMGLAGAIGLVIGALACRARSRPTLGRLLMVASAVVCAMLASLAARGLNNFSMPIATLAGLIVLVPGMRLTTAMTELATGNLISGTARLLSAAVTFLELGFGVALGTKLGAVLFAPAMPVPQDHLVGWTQWPAIALAAVALGVVLQAHRRDLPWILAVSLLGNLGSVLGRSWLGGELGAFLAALWVGLASHAFARRTRRTPAITQAPAILLLVPGGVGYRSISALMQRDVVAGMQIAFSAALTATALVAGVLLANVLFPARRVS